MIHPEYNSISNQFPSILSKNLVRRYTQKHFEVFGVYPVEYLFDLFPIPVSRDPKKKPYHPPRFIDLEGFSVNVGSSRMRLFLRDRNKLHCVSCGVKPTHWVLERFPQAKNMKDVPPPHINLYSFVENEHYVHELLFTQDHILPQSTKGSSSLKNLQVMCTVCNNKKGAGIICGEVKMLNPLIVPESARQSLCHSIE